MNYTHSELSRVARSQLADGVSGNGVLSDIALKQAVFELGEASSRKTIAMFNAELVLDLVQSFADAEPAASETLPSLTVAQDSEDAFCLRVTGVTGLDRIRHAISRGEFAVPVVVGFDASPNRPDDGVWCLMTSPPNHLINGARAMEMPYLPVTAESVGVDETFARHVGAAMDAYGAVLNSVPRNIEASSDPVGNKAETVAFRNIDDLPSFSTEELFSKATRAARSFMEDQRNEADATRLMNIFHKPVAA